MKKQIKEKLAYEVMDHDKQTKVLSSLSEYDRQGNLTLHINYFPSGDIFTEHAYTYKKNLLVQEREWNENGDCSTIDYAYDTSDRCILKTLSFLDGTKQIEKREYVDQKEILTLYDEFQQEVEKQVLIYDTDKKLIGNDFYENRNLVESSRFKYDLNGENTERMIEDYVNETKYIYTYFWEGQTHIALEKNGVGEITSKTISVYEQDLLIQKIEEYRDLMNNNYSRFYEYDERGNLIKETHKNYAGHTVAQTNYKYNENQDVIELLTLSSVSHLNIVEGAYLNKTTLMIYELSYFDA